MNAREMGAVARENSKDAAARMQQPLIDMGRKIKEILANFKIDDVAGAAGIMEKLRDLIAKLAPPPAAGGESGEKRGGIGGLANPGGKLEAMTDRLARIGGFIGGAGGPGVDYARRTARAVEIMAGVMQRNRGIDAGLAVRQELLAVYN